MAEQTEDKMFQRLETVVSGATALGASYKPPNPIAAAALMGINLAAAQPLRLAFQQSEADESLARHHRSDLHAVLDKFVADLITFCVSAGVAASNLALMRSLKRELRGRPAKKKEDNPATPGIDESKSGSSPAQTSYPSRTGHFSGIVEIYRALNLKPDEDRFKQSILDAMVADLHAADTAVISVVTAKNQARAALDALLYTNLDNLVDAANSAKNYLKSRFADQPVYQAVKNMRFNKPARLTK